jgi:predicted Zn-dependent peptidase
MIPSMNEKRIKTIIVSLILSTAAGFCLKAAEQNKGNNTFRLLDNGLKVLLVKRDTIPLVNMVFAINVGSKDETADTSGLVHVLEHLILLGETEKRDSDAMNLEMRRYGAYFNAHTSHDMMTFEFSLPAQYWEKGLELLKEKLFLLKFSSEKLEKEKQIIFEEMAQNRDNPYKRSFLLALQHLFKGHPYEQPIPGSREVIEKASIDRIKAFYKDYFSPANCALAVVGDIDPQMVAKKIDAILGTLEKKEKPGTLREFKPTPPLKKNFKLTEQMDIQQARLVIGFHAPPSNHDDQLAVQVFDQVVGKGLNPLLATMMLRRGRRMTYSISTSYIPLKYGGAFLVFMAVDPKNLKAVKRTVLQFFNRTAWNFKYSIKDYPLNSQLHTTDFLEMARNTIKYGYQEFQEEGKNAAINYARYLLFHNNDKTAKDTDKNESRSYMERLEEITSINIRDAASKYFSGKKYVAITLMPAKKN